MSLDCVTESTTVSKLRHWCVSYRPTQYIVENIKLSSACVHYLMCVNCRNILNAYIGQVSHYRVNTEGSTHTRTRTRTYTHTHISRMSNVVNYMGQVAILRIYVSSLTRVFYYTYFWTVYSNVRVSVGQNVKRVHCTYNVFFENKRICAKYAML